MAAKGFIDIRIPDRGPVLNVFRNLTPELQKSSITAAVFAASGVIQKAVRAAAPRGSEPSRKTRRVYTRFVGAGRARTRLRLAKPATVSYDFGRLHQNIVRRRSRKGEDLGAVLVGNGKAFWGHFLEKGTKHQRARPFFFRAVEGARGQFVTRLAVEIEAKVAAAAVRLGGKAR